LLSFHPSFFGIFKGGVVVVALYASRERLKGMEEMEALMLCSAMAKKNA
jgi:hypothetical protein